MNRNSHYSWFCNKANRKIFGVCSGLAAYYGHSVSMVRIIAVLLLFVISRFNILGLCWCRSGFTIAL